ncbi:MAG: histidine phosphatase family protein [Pirellulaceae bacterium]
MVQFLLIRPGSTDFDEQGRIKGTLDIPLSEIGALQVGRLVAELHETPIHFLYSSPCTSAEQTARSLAVDHRLKVKLLDDLQNLDHGLWHGKLVDEVKHGQPKVFRQLQDHPETVCPPEGEPVGAAMERVKLAMQRLLRKHKTGTVALVVPEPLASLVASTLGHSAVGDLWKVECQGGGWQAIEAGCDLAGTAARATGSWHAAAYPIS